MKTIRRRRLEKKTDYKSRFGLLKSGKIRLVVRKSNKYISAQIVETNIAQDKVLIGVSSKDLLEKGWPKDKTGSLKNLQAAYLTGYYIGTLAKKSKINEMILDIGLNRNIHKSRLFSLLKGVVDSGIDIPHDPEALPTEEDLNKDEKLGALINKIKDKL